VKCRDMNRQAWLWLGLGTFLRLFLIGQPPVEDNSWIRQTQTADAIASWVEESPSALSARASWRGDLNARLLQELPLYNLIVYGGAILGIPLHVAGRAVSILLWGASFFVIQRIWSRWLTPQERFGQTCFLSLARYRLLLVRPSCLKC